MGTLRKEIQRITASIIASGGGIFFHPRCRCVWCGSKLMDADAGIAGAGSDSTRSLGNASYCFISFSPHPALPTLIIGSSDDRSEAGLA